MTARDLAVVIPAWNEARRLEVDSIREFVQAHPALALVLVNDGSTDATPQLLESVRESCPGQVTVLHLERNMGKGEAVRRGLLRGLEDGHRFIGYLDADQAAPLATMHLLAGELGRHPGVQLLLGSRVKLLGWAIARSERRHYPGRIFATFASLALGLPVYDTQCGAKLLRTGAVARAALAEPFRSRWLFDVELIARIRDIAGAAALREVPIPEWADRGGSSVRLRDFLKAPLELWRIRRRYPPR